MGGFTISRVLVCDAFARGSFFSGVVSRLERSVDSEDLHVADYHAHHRRLGRQRAGGRKKSDEMKHGKQHHKKSKSSTHIHEGKSLIKESKRKIEDGGKQQGYWKKALIWRWISALYASKALPSKRAKSVKKSFVKLEVSRGIDVKPGMWQNFPAAQDFLRPRMPQNFSAEEGTMSLGEFQNTPVTQNFISPEVLQIVPAVHETMGFKEFQNTSAAQDLMSPKAPQNISAVQATANPGESQGSPAAQSSIRPEVQRNASAVQRNVNGVSQEPPVMKPENTILNFTLPEMPKITPKIPSQRPTNLIDQDAEVFTQLLFDDDKIHTLEAISQKSQKSESKVSTAFSDQPTTEPKAQLNERQNSRAVFWGIPPADGIGLTDNSEDAAGGTAYHQIPWDGVSAYRGVLKDRRFRLDPGCGDWFAGLFERYCGALGTPAFKCVKGIFNAMEQVESGKSSPRFEVKESSSNVFFYPCELSTPLSDIKNFCLQYNASVVWDEFMSFEDSFRKRILREKNLFLPFIGLVGVQTAADIFLEDEAASALIHFISAFQKAFSGIESCIANEDAEGYLGRVEAVDCLIVFFKNLEHPQQDPKWGESEGKVLLRHFKSGIAEDPKAQIVFHQFLKETTMPARVAAAALEAVVGRTFGSLEEALQVAVNAAEQARDFQRVRPFVANELRTRVSELVTLKWDDVKKQVVADKVEATSVAN